MASFTVRGARNGSLVHITWSDGQLSGDPPTVDLVEVEAETVKAYLADPAFATKFQGQYGGLAAEPLDDPSSAYRLIRLVLDVVREVTGDVPPEAQEEGSPAGA